MWQGNPKASLGCRENIDVGLFRRTKNRQLPNLGAFLHSVRSELPGLPLQPAKCRLGHSLNSTFSFAGSQRPKTPRPQRTFGIDIGKLVGLDPESLPFLLFGRARVPFCGLLASAKEISQNHVYADQHYQSTD